MAEREIIGVVGSVKHRGFSREPRPEMTLPSDSSNSER
jgi:hypothetical protein